MMYKRLLIKSFIAFSTLSLVFITQCKTTSTDEGVYCINCIAEQPDSERIAIKLTINEDNKKVPLVVFEGKFYPGNMTDTVFFDTITLSDITIKVATNKFYTIQATYKQNEKIIYAIDGGIFETKKLIGCQNDCWQLIGGKYDVRLKKY